VNLDTGQLRQSRQTADAGGRLHFILNGERHEIGITEAARPILTVTDWGVAAAPWATAGKPVRLELTLLNKGAARARAATATLTSANPQVKIERERLTLPPLAPGRRASVRTVFLVEDPQREIVQFKVRLGDAEIPVEVPLFADAPQITDFKILDGTRQRLWERAVRTAEKVLGSGNGDSRAQPGETIALAVPDGEALRAVELFSWDACLDLSQRLSDPWSAYDNVGATAKITLARIKQTCAEGREIPLFVRYQIPNKPDHILKEGVVRLRLAGRSGS
jgi:hypothetical protein